MFLLMAFKKANLVSRKEPDFLSTNIQDLLQKQATSIILPGADRSLVVCFFTWKKQNTNKMNGLRPILALAI